MNKSGLVRSDTHFSFWQAHNLLYCKKQPVLKNQEYRPAHDFFGLGGD
jgi:hypothetical protein